MSSETATSSVRILRGSVDSVSDIAVSDNVAAWETQRSCW